MSKVEFLERMRAARHALNESISGMNDDQMTHGLVTDDWSVKDILAFQAAWQGEALIWIERADRGEALGPSINESTEEWERQRVIERRRLPLVDVMQEFNDQFDQLSEILERAPEDRIPLGPAGWDETARLWWLTDRDARYITAIQTYRASLALDSRG